MDLISYFFSCIVMLNSFESEFAGASLAVSINVLFFYFKKNVLLTDKFAKARALFIPLIVEVLDDAKFISYILKGLWGDVNKFVPQTGEKCVDFILALIVFVFILLLIFAFFCESVKFIVFYNSNFIRSLLF